MTPDLAQIKARHYECQCDLDNPSLTHHCHTCEHKWPCDTITLLDWLVASEEHTREV